MFAAVTVLIIVFNRIFKWSDWLLDPDSFELLKALVDENLPLSLMIYMILTVVACVMLALPGMIFAILAGVLFGPWLGTLVCSMATTIGAVIAFLLGRFFLKDSIEPLLSKNPLLKKYLFDKTGINQVLLLMMTRLVPIFPYNLQNFGYGITNLSCSMYALVSFIFMLPGTAMYTIGAAGLTGGKNRYLYLGTAIFLALIVMGTGIVLKKKYLKEEENGG